MLDWLRQFNIFCLLDNHDYQLHHHKLDCIVAIGAEGGKLISSLEELDDYYGKSWLFGHISYEFKNELYNFPATKEDKIEFPLLQFFVPTILIHIKGSEVEIEAEDPQRMFDDISIQKIPWKKVAQSYGIKGEFQKEEYLRKVSDLQKHIALGNCYEINFCQQFSSEGGPLDPFHTYLQLVRVSPNPYTAFYRLKDSYVICASPERFLLKEGNKILSQPMKGTIRRDINDRQKDEGLKKELQSSLKERSENVMVVDLVRNDLSHIAEDVKVDGLFEIQTFPNVHQMISTVTGQLKEGILFSDIIKATFPMGSMTGAPKYRVMQLIDEYETSARGIFSGTIGYINPGGDFDFNVVIRSIMYNAAKEFISYKVGSGITIYSDPEKEWIECLLKAEGIKKVLQD